MDPVDIGQGAGGVGPGGDRGHVGPGAEHVAGRGDRDQPGPLGRPARRTGRPAARRWPGRPRPSAPPPRPGRRLDPGPDVGVVVQPGHDHLVAGRPARGQGGRQPVGEGGHVRAEDDAVRLAADQVGDGPAALGDDPVRAAAGREGPAHVADPGPVGAGDGVDHRRRHLGAGGPVQVGEAVAQGRVQRPHPAASQLAGAPPRGSPDPCRPHRLTTRTPRGRRRRAGQDLVEPVQRLVVEVDLERAQRLLELLDGARADDRRGHARLVQQPGQGDVGGLARPARRRTPRTPRAGARCFSSRLRCLVAGARPSPALRSDAAEQAAVRAGSTG